MSIREEPERPYQHGHLVLPVLKDGSTISLQKDTAHVLEILVVMPEKEFCVP
jgi:hypothetical protein